MRSSRPGASDPHTLKGPDRDLSIQPALVDHPQFSTQSANGRIRRAPGTLNSRERNLLLKYPSHIIKKPKKRIISKLVDRIFHESLAWARDERQIAPQASAGYCPPYLLCLPSAKPTGAGKKGPKDNRTPPPQLRSNPCLMIASKMAFIPSPWNDRTFYICQFFDPQLNWIRSQKKNPGL